MCAKQTKFDKWWFKKTIMNQHHVFTAPVFEGYQSVLYSQELRNLVHQAYLEGRKDMRSEHEPKHE